MIFHSSFWVSVVVCFVVVCWAPILRCKLPRWVRVGEDVEAWNAGAPETSEKEEVPLRVVLTLGFAHTAGETLGSCFLHR